MSNFLDQEITAVASSGGANRDSLVGALARVSYDFKMGRQITIVAGLDSLTEGASGTTYRSYLKPSLLSEFGDPGTPGWVPCDNTTMTDVLGANPLSITNMTYTTALAWSDPIRQKSFYGLGLCHAAASASGSWNATIGNSRIPGATTNFLGFRLMVLLRSSDASFRWRSGNVEGTGTATTVSVSGGYTQDKVLTLTRAWNSSLGTSPALIIDQIVGDVTFLAFEPVTALPGVKFVNLAKFGQKPSEWAQMDDTVARDIARIMRPRLAIINGGMNGRDTDNAVSFGRYMEIIVDRWQTLSSTNILLVRPHDSSDATSTNLASYTPIIASIAASRGCGYIDDRAVVGSDYATALAAGNMADPVHTSAQANALRSGAYMGRVLNFLSGTSYVP